MKDPWPPSDGCRTQTRPFSWRLPSLSAVHVPPSQGRIPSAWDEGTVWPRLPPPVRNLQVRPVADSFPAMVVVTVFRTPSSKRGREPAYRQLTQCSSQEETDGRNTQLPTSGVVGERGETRLASPQLHPRRSWKSFLSIGDETIEQPIPESIQDLPPNLLQL